MHYATVFRDPRALFKNICGGDCRVRTTLKDPDVRASGDEAVVIVSPERVYVRDLSQNARNVYIAPRVPA